jgi:hypothetical protein
MKKLNIHIFFTAIACLLMVSCTKYNNALNTTNNNNTPVNSIDTPPSIKFYNAMDFGSTDISLNGRKVTSIAKYYASSYITAREGTNNISLNFPGKTADLNGTVDLVRNTSYSCFFYKVGNEWKYDLVKDEIKTRPPANYAFVRILDFRTEAYFNYINVRMTAPGLTDIDQKNRNFLDHKTFSSYTQFRPVIAGNYNFFFYNDTITASRRFNVPIDNLGIYTVMLTTPGNITPYTEAIKYIFPDVVKHN